MEIEKETEELLRYKGDTDGGSGVKTYKVHFEAGEGMVSQTDRNYVQGASYNRFPMAYRLGYDFLGWYDSAGNRVTETSIATSNATLTAKWSRIILKSGSCGDHLVYALYGDGLLEITGSGEMTSAPWTEYSNRIGEVSLPEGLTSICASAFSGCVYLHEIGIPASVKEIGDSAFEETGLQSLSIPNGVEILGAEILSGTPGVKSIIVPGSVVTMYSKWHSSYSSGWWRGEEGTFCGSYIESVVFEPGIKELGKGLFYNVKTLKSVTIPNTVETILDLAFSGCDELSDIYIKGSEQYWQSITKGYGNDVFDIVSFHFSEETEPTPDFLLPAALTRIEAEAFANNAFTYVKLGENVKSIDSRAFADCENLRHIYIPEGTYPIASDAFSGVPTGLTIHGEEDSYAELYAYKYGYRFVAE